jgi:hypothetical protein
MTHARVAQKRGDIVHIEKDIGLARTRERILIRALRTLARIRCR